MAGVRASDWNALVRSERNAPMRSASPGGPPDSRSMRGVLERLRSAYEAGNGASYAADFYTEGIFSIELMSLANYVTVALEAGGDACRSRAVLQGL